MCKINKIIDFLSYNTKIEAFEVENQPYLKRKKCDPT